MALLSRWWEVTYHNYTSAHYNQPSLLNSIMFPISQIHGEYRPELPSIASQLSTSVLSLIRASIRGWFDYWRRCERCDWPIISLPLQTSFNHRNPSVFLWQTAIRPITTCRGLDMCREWDQSAFLRV